MAGSRSSVEAGWRAGAASRTIDVPPGTPLDGYGEREGGAAGVHRPLEVNAVYLACGGSAALVVGIDLLAVDRAWVHVLRRRLQERAGLPAAAVMVAASHTHAGPLGFRRQPPAPRAYPGRRRLRRHALRRALEAALEAVDGARPARVTLAAAEVEGVAANRRDPGGPLDRRLTALWIRDERDGPIGCLWHFACHPTVLGADNRRVSPDLPGEVRALLRREGASPGPVVYLNGAAADVSTRFVRRGRGLEELTRLAGMLVERFPREGQPLEPAKPVALLREVRLRPAAPVDPREAARTLEEAERMLEQARVRGAPEAERRRREVEVLGARKRLERSGRSLRPLATAVQVLRLGACALVGFPGELYAAQGLRLRDESPAPLTLAVGYAGDYVGYLPPSGGGGGYEEASAVVAPGTGDELVARAVMLLREVGSA